MPIEGSNFVIQRFEIDADLDGLEKKKRLPLRENRHPVRDPQGRVVSNAGRIDKASHSPA